MFSDVLCCFQMFSDVPRMVSIVHRRFIDILKCVQDVFRCFHQMFKDVERCWEMVLDVLPIFSRCSLDVALMFSSCSPGLSIEFSVCSPEMWSNSILRWKYYLWWSKKIWRSLRDGLPKKSSCSFRVCPNYLGPPPPPPNLDNLYHFFWPPMCQKKFGQGSPPPSLSPNWLHVYTGCPEKNVT